MSTIEVKVPDIGDFAEVEVIEVLVKAGDMVRLEQSLVTVESDKASMEIPSSAAGRVASVAVKVGSKVAEGSLLVTLEAAEAGQGPAPAPEAASTTAANNAAAPAAPAPSAAPTPASTPASPPASTGASYDCQVLVIGGGPGGYSAAFRAADLGLKTILVERYPTLGGVCLNVGCIPSKALLHSAAVIDAALAMGGHGISFSAPKIDRAKLRGWKDEVVAKLTGGLTAMAKGRKVTVIRGYAQFTDPHTVRIETTEGSGQKRGSESRSVTFEHAVIAAGSEPIRLPFVPEDPRIVDSTAALSLEIAPKRMLVLGGGIIGLELGTVYSTLGARLDVVEMSAGLMPGADRDLVRVWQKFNQKRFDAVMLETRAVKVEPQGKKGVKVWFEGKQAPAEPQTYDLVLSAVGRSPNGGKVGADKAGVTVDQRGFIPVDKQMRTNVPHIFAIGDLVGQPMLAHKAVHEGHVAADAAAGHKAFMDARVIPSVAYTDPEVAWVGVTEEQAKAQGLAIGKSQFPWGASGRAIANGRDEGFTKLLFDEKTGRIVGGGIVGTNAGDMIGEVALAIEMGADAVDIGRTIHPHPTLGETIGLAAEVFEGVCTDLMPPRKPRGG